MRLKLSLVLVSVSALAVVGAAALAETKVEVKGVHLCCKACVKGVDAAFKGVEGATATCDQKNGTVTITAQDEATAQKALDVLAGSFVDMGLLTAKPDMSKLYTEQFLPKQ